MRHTRPVISYLLYTLLASVISQTAQADSVNEWAYWDANPPVDPAGFQLAFNTQNNYVSAEQQRVGTNQGELVQSTSTSTGVSQPWIGYLFVSSAYNTNVEVNKVATIGLNPNAATTSVTISGASGATILDFSSNNVTFGSTNGSFTFNQSTANGGYYAITGDGRLNSEPFSQLFSVIQIIRSNSSPSFYANLYGLIGKLMSTADVSSLLSGGGTYTLGGVSYPSVGNISMTVNFANATWTSTWNGVAFSYNPFNASGTISGNTLTSTSVTSTGNSGIAYAVQSGTITGNLIGTSAGNNFGVIGKAELTVNSAGSGTATVNTPFFVRQIQNNN